MNKYECIVYDTKGKRTRITVKAINESDIINKLRKESLEIVQINKSSFYNMNKFRKLRKSNIKYICKHMSLMHKSGIGISTSSKLLSENKDKSIRDVGIHLMESLRLGKEINVCFNELKVFPQFFVSMIRIGERSGNLEKVLVYLHDYYDKEHKLQTKIRNIMMYPCALICTSMVSIMIIFTFVIPKISSMYLEDGSDMPEITNNLIIISDIIKDIFPSLLITTIISLFILYILSKMNEQISIIIGYISIKIPIIKNITLKKSTISISKALYIQLSSGISIIQAIENTSSVVNNSYIKTKLDECKSSILKGNKIADSFRYINVFDSEFLEMIKIGEESGQIEHILLDVIELYEYDLEIMIEKNIKLIEPVVIIFIGILVLILSISVLYPMNNMLMNI